LFIRNMFVREEGAELVVGAGITKAWRDSGQPLIFGPTPTRFGPLTIRIERLCDRLSVSWIADWNGKIPQIRVNVPGLDARSLNGTAASGVILNAR
jgi:hypothetical protein